MSGCFIESASSLIPASAFRKALLRWYDASRRDLPWRESADFYRVWVSEIMLQQTRVETVIPYYRRFLERFPTIEALAGADETEVLAAWSGLGYYRRARHLYQAARQVAARARHPQTFAELLALPGCGSYTAAAVASIAMGLPHAAVDGNVKRVICRLADRVCGTSGIGSLAGALLDRRRPGDFNQAMMELGATICVPGDPRCPACPVRKFCGAYAAGTVCDLPVRAKSKRARDVPLDLIIFEDDARVFLTRRGSSEPRLADFWELPEKRLFPLLRAVKAGEFRHQIVNDRFRVAVWRAAARNSTPKLPRGQWFGNADLAQIPLATMTRKAITLTRPEV